MAQEEEVCEVTLKQSRETKGTVLFEADNPEGAPLRNLYVSKIVLSKPYPERIKVSVSTVK